MKFRIKHEIRGRIQINEERAAKEAVYDDEDLKEVEDEVEAEAEEAEAETEETAAEETTEETAE